jgi:hypothetical protein
MFSWHETTRCRVCRSLFAALGVLPLCTVLLAAAWIGTPVSTHYFEDALAQQLALRTSLDAVRFPRPGVVEYRQLKLIDPETRELVGVFEFLQVDHSGSKTKITCNLPELNQDRFDLLWEQIWRFSRLQAGGKTPRELTAERLTLGSMRGAPIIELYDVRLEFVASDEGPQTVISFRINPSKQSPYSLLTISRKGADGSSAFVKLQSEAKLPPLLMKAICADWRQSSSRQTLTGSLQSCRIGASRDSQGR